MAAKRGGAQAKSKSNSNTKKPALDSIDAAAAALNKAEVRQLQFDPLLAKSACDTGLKVLKPHRAELKEKYPGFNLAEFDELPVIADRVRVEQRKVQTTSSAAGSLDSILAGLKMCRVIVAA